MPRGVFYIEDTPKLERVPSTMASVPTIPALRGLGLLGRYTYY